MLSGVDRVRLAKRGGARVSPRAGLSRRSVAGGSSRGMSLPAGSPNGPVNGPPRWPRRAALEEAELGNSAIDRPTDRSGGRG